MFQVILDVKPFTSNIPQLHLNWQVLMISRIVVRYSLITNFAILFSKYSIVKKELLLFNLFGMSSMLRYLNLFMLLNAFESRSSFNKISSKSLVHHLEICFNKVQPTDICAIHAHWIPLDSPYFVSPWCWVAWTISHIHSSSFKRYWDVWILLFLFLKNFCYENQK